MTKEILIDACEAGRLRVAIVENGLLCDFFQEGRKGTKRQKGNIYLVKVKRLEPSLQAAFVDYGGERHGFLPFNEIHPIYYQIPVGDQRPSPASSSSSLPPGGEAGETDDADSAPEPNGRRGPTRNVALLDAGDAGTDTDTGLDTGEMPPEGDEDSHEPYAEATSGETSREMSPETPETYGEEEEYGQDPSLEAETEAEEGLPPDDHDQADFGVDDPEADYEPVTDRHTTSRHYKIQEVIKLGQKLLVQVTKEERGDKCATLTTYLSLPGRFCVFMPLTVRKGGVSRKIEPPEERRRMRQILDDLPLGEDQAVILRTAGLNRTKAEIARDFQFLKKLWDDIYEETMSKSSLGLVYEEANLLRRVVRDMYDRDVATIWVEGGEAHKTLRETMEKWIPSHSKRVRPYRRSRGQIGEKAIFQHFDVERQILELFSTRVSLPSGGSLVIDQTEALTAVDVNSGKSTRGRQVEDMALHTNLEAADEVARQMRLRDLSGLIIVDFIDMEQRRNNTAVEKRFREALASDNAQVRASRISQFGLLEVSRQRLAPSFFEENYSVCTFCHGRGKFLQPDMVAEWLLHFLETELHNGKRTASLQLQASVELMSYLLGAQPGRFTALLTEPSCKIEVQVDANLPGTRFNLYRTALRNEDETIRALPEKEYEAIDFLSNLSHASSAKASRRHAHPKAAPASPPPAAGGTGGTGGTAGSSTGGTAAPQRGRANARGNSRNRSRTPRTPKTTPSAPPVDRARQGQAERQGDERRVDAQDFSIPAEVFEERDLMETPGKTPGETATPDHDSRLSN